MDIQHKLIKYFQIMAFNKYIIVFILFLTVSCKRADDAWNEIQIENSTKDTIGLNFRRLGGTPSGFEHKIFPKDKFCYARAVHASDYDLIRDNWGRNGDTIEIFRNDTLMVKWGAPLRNLPDSIHSFYNENSWIIENGGRKDKYIIATFTITEDDFKK